MAMAASTLAGSPFFDPATGDVIDSVLQDLDQAGKARLPSKEFVPLKARAEAISTTAEVKPFLDGLADYIRRHPTDEKLQRLVAVAFGRVQDPRAATVWRGIDRRFPESDIAPARIAREVYRSKGADAARAYIEDRLTSEDGRPERLFLRARAYLEIREPDLAEDPLRAVIEHPESDQRLLTKTARLLVKHGWLADADNAAQLLTSKFGHSYDGNLLLNEIKHLRSIAPDEDKKVPSILLGVIDQIIETAQGVTKIRSTARSSRSLGSVVMIGGSLAPGGAERQFVETALGLHRASEAGIPIGDIDIHGPVTPIVRSINSRSADNFYLPKFRQAGLRIHEYCAFEPYGGRPRQSVIQPIASLLRHLPGRTQEGIVRLADALRYLAPEVAHIWQDGSILATGVAAVMAGIPRIVLGARTMPPTERHDREKPEYHPIFQRLLAQPGVTLLSNSSLVAKRYADWLELDYRSLRVVPNGVAVPEMTPTARSLELAQALPSSPDRFVVGCVARFAEVKRPLLWIECAAAIREKCPEAYFVMVGHGPLLEAVAARAEALGLRDRLLLTGVTPDVGYWFSQMDVHLLLSRYEGLPNVLIEAQMCGVPVVTTPAGGSAEAMAHGVTGTVLDSVETVDPHQVADAVLGWRRDANARLMLAETLRDWATSRFSVERMLELTVQIYME